VLDFTLYFENNNNFNRGDRGKGVGVGVGVERGGEVLYNIYTFETYDLIINMRHGGFSVGSAIIIIINVIIIINNCSSINIINMIISIIIHLTIRQRLGCGFERGFGGDRGGRGGMDN